MYKGTVEDVIRKMYQTEKKLDAVNPVAVKKAAIPNKENPINQAFLYPILFAIAAAGIINILTESIYPIASH